MTEHQAALFRERAPAACFRLARTASGQPPHRPARPGAAGSARIRLIAVVAFVAATLAAVSFATTSRNPFVGYLYAVF